MGASYLTDIITCQIKKEKPTKTLSEFCLDSDVVRPPWFLSFENKPLECYKSILRHALCFAYT
jgi:hypothetical protein